MRGHPWFAASYDFLTQFAERGVLRPLRLVVVGGAAGDVLEIGAGTGASLPYYRQATEIVAVEPDPFMLKRARGRAAKLGLAVEFHQSSVEELPFPDGSFDTVVSTLVLCNVADQAVALAEIKRVLRAGGSLRFIEHVRGEGLLGRLHDLVEPAWVHIAAGCHPNRRTAESIAAAGFELSDVDKRRLPLAPLISGAALKTVVAH